MKPYQQQHLYNNAGVIVVNNDHNINRKNGFKCHIDSYNDNVFFYGYLTIESPDAEN
jgi:hypothetical protein